MQVTAAAIGLAKVGVAGSNPVVRSIQVQVSGLSGPLIRVRDSVGALKSAGSPRPRFRGERSPDRADQDYIGLRVAWGRFVGY
jgi:hypothetical protein